MNRVRNTRATNATRIAFGLLLLAIISASLFPGVSRPTIFASDKMDHIFAFFVLGSAAKFFWQGHRPITLFSLLALGGAGIEIVQWGMQAGREADWADFAADLFGAGVGILMADTINAIRTRLFGPAYL
ncbi:hypothetical protein [Erythrobacter aureus]|uniref:VanZ family protein n=1 Tax=Erythrobacter aureus TaxID=2182384 RepID=A0A345YIE2_9SPHN|nr:hypothetical protein [Erythrobacter aureus]AXK43694.1 hypothetical protein DVR09_14640 [Erythrobacter aureus]